LLEDSLIGHGHDLGRPEAGLLEHLILAAG
jgi:hypothetical protein